MINELWGFFPQTKDMSIFFLCHTKVFEKYGFKKASRQTFLTICGFVTAGKSFIATKDSKVRQAAEYAREH